MTTLTKRECEVLEWAAEGFSNKEIAQEMGCRPYTVQWYMADILRRMNARDRVHAVAMAIRRGLIS
jgi:LuxR family transcriptional regulator